jgi:hypothetical protein
MSWRRLGVLLEGLPPESLWWTAIRRRPESKPGGDVDAVRWGTTHELLAGVIDASHEVAWTIAQVNSNRDVPKPSPYPRPRVGRPEQAAAMTAKNRARVDTWAESLRRRKAGGTDGN